MYKYLYSKYIKYMKIQKYIQYICERFLTQIWNVLCTSVGMDQRGLLSEFHVQPKRLKLFNWSTIEIDGGPSRSKIERPGRRVNSLVPMPHTNEEGPLRSHYASSSLGLQDPEASITIATPPTTPSQPRYCYSL